jgi:hypothetical protein
VVRIECKASHDHAEGFDGTPSQHDGKDAAVLSEMAFNGKGKPWPLHLSDERSTTMRTLVERATDHHQESMLWTGRLEGLLGRHWPEASRILDLGSATLLKALIEYGTPAALAEDGEAEEKLRSWGGWALSQEKIQALVHSARTTAGVPGNAVEVERVREYAARALAVEDELSATRRKLEKMVDGDEVLERMAAAVGKATACVLLVLLGDPRNYGSMRAYLKAAGLNLKERSSGKYQGELKISKRGPSLVRRWLYMAALRLSGQAPGAAWFARKRERDVQRSRGGPRRKRTGKIGLVALMRRLLGAVWHINRKKEPFDVHRMFGASGRAPGRKAAMAAAAD